MNLAVNLVLPLITKPGEAHRPLSIITEVKESLADRMPRPGHGGHGPHSHRLGEEAKISTQRWPIVCVENFILSGLKNAGGIKGHF